MNEKTRAQIEAMKNQTIGVEVEMNNITREKAAKKAAEFFGTRRYEYTAGRNGYYTWSAWDAQGREWKFQRDVSIEGPDSDLRRHRDAPAAYQSPPKGRGTKLGKPGLRSPYPHRRAGAYAENDPEPGQHHGGT